MPVTLELGGKSPVVIGDKVDMLNGWVQTGDGENRNGTGGSDKPDLKNEFSNTSHLRGTVSMARTADPDSANSQFFICFDAAPHLDGQYTVFGQVIEGMEFVDGLKRGAPGSGTVDDPDEMVSVKVLADL